MRLKTKATTTKRNESFHHFILILLLLSVFGFGMLVGSWKDNIMESSMKLFPKNNTVLRNDTATAGVHPPSNATASQDSALGVTTTTISRRTDTTTIGSLVPLKSASLTTTISDCCWDDSNVSSNCCRRVIGTTHKMGTALILDVKEQYKFVSHYGIGHTDVKAMGFQVRKLLQPKTAQRLVMVIRNLYDAIISGYLYHKSGRECWLDPRGNPTRMSSVRKEIGWDWEAQFNHTAPVVPRRGRSICKYLEEESEKDGLRVFIEFSFGFYWQALERLYLHGMSNTNSPLYGRTAFACYEALNNMTTRHLAVQQIMDFWYPGGHNSSHMAAMSPTTAPAPKVEGNGHATSHDPVLRSRLHQIIQELDKEVFAGKVERHQEYFGC